MVGPIRNSQPVAELEIDDLVQEIDEPLGDSAAHADEPTLTKIDFDQLDVSLDL